MQQSGKGRRESEGREIGRRNRGWESTGPFFGYVLGHVPGHVLITSRPYTPGGQVELLRWNEKDVTNDGGVYLKVRPAVEALPRRAAAFAVGSPRRPDPRSGRVGVRITTEGRNRGINRVVDGPTRSRGVGPRGPGTGTGPGAEEPSESGPGPPPGSPTGASRRRSATARAGGEDCGEKGNRWSGECE